jgi:hypothetical protein
MRRLTNAVLLAVLSLPLIAQPAPPPARFCIAPVGADLMNGDCRDVTSDEIEVAADAKTRSWLFLDGERKLLVLGTLEPTATKITVSRKSSAFFTITGSANHGWPAATKVTIGSRTNRWVAMLPAKVAASLRNIAVADGAYDVTLEAPHHFKLEKKNVRASADVPAILEQLKLQPLPALRGRFIDKEGGPLADVAVATPEGKLLATSSAAGEVREELSEKIPQRLFVRRAGFGSKTIENARVEGDLDFGTITLSAGAMLTIDVDRKEYTGPLTASLIKTAEHTRGKRTTFATAQVDGGTSRIVLEDLEARDYVLIFRGEGALQTVMKPITIAEREKVTLSIALDSYRVRGLVHRGADPYEAAEVGFGSGNGEWFVTTRTDSGGRLELDAWFKGKVSITVDPTDTHYTTSREVTAPLNEWDIELPDRRIRGIVVDKTTGKPLPQAVLSVRYALSNGLGGARRVKLRDDATFELDFLEPGRFDFDTSLAPYLPAKMNVELTAADRERDVRLELEEGKRVQLQIVDSSGRPPAGAEVIGVRADRRVLGGRWMVEANGITTVILAPDETKKLWVLTPYDTFTQLTVRAADAGTKPMRVALPPPVATLVMKVQREDGTPVSGVHVFMRYNGIHLDDDARGYFQRRGTRMQTGSDGVITMPRMPTGEYEVWGRELAAQNVTSDGRPMGNVVRVSALAGENVVKLVMAPPVK